ncbi:MAG: PD40 domain-containing protein [Dehalococcoidia bacterium]|nr:PD40 domain-containing protein [Dehalococcoidia bacterium]
MRRRRKAEADANRGDHLHSDNAAGPFHGPHAPLRNRHVGRRVGRPFEGRLADAAAGSVRTLYESSDQLAWHAQFAGAVVEVVAGPETLRFTFDGLAVTPATTGRRCSALGGVVTVEGRAYPDVAACGSFSPDGKWMLFQKDAGQVQLPAGFSVPSWDQWVLDVATGETTELQKGLFHCGGCDARYGPRWSSTGRYVAYAELGGDLRRFLSDVGTGSTRQIGAGSDVALAPAWHPTEDRIIYSQAAELSGPAVYEDLGTGSKQQLPLPWPVAFDASGDYLYSPAWGPSPKADAGMTTIIDADSFETVAALPGAAPAWLLWRSDAGAVVVGADGPVAAFQGAPGCDGTAVYAGSSTARCVTGGRFGAPNASGTFVAVATLQGTVGPVRGPGFESLVMARYSIELMDVRSGDVQTLIREVISWDGQPPILRWNGDGTHFVVVAPAATGL